MIPTLQSNPNSAAPSAPAILLESGSYLLLEDGSKILLE